MRFPLRLTAFVSLLLVATTVFAQPCPKDAEPALRQGLEQLQSEIAQLKTNKKLSTQLMADVEVYAKAVEWCLRHDEFYVPKNSKTPNPPSAYVKHCQDAIAAGLARAAELKTGGKPSWSEKTGSTIRGYVSRVDGSVQPYALSLPKTFASAKSGHRWPLHLVLHGRGGDRNEVRFASEHSKKQAADDQDWIQLDVFGRTDNAYRCQIASQASRCLQ